VGDEDAEVFGRVRDEGRGDGRDGGFESDGDEDDFLVRVLACDLDCFRYSLDDPDIAFDVFEGGFGSGDPEKVSVGADDAAPLGKFACSIDLSLRGDADRAAGSHHDLHLRRKDGSYAVFCDGGFMGAADVHDPDVCIHYLGEFFCNIRAERHMYVYCTSLHIITSFRIAGWTLKAVAFS